MMNLIIQLISGSGWWNSLQEKQCPNLIWELLEMRLRDLWEAVLVDKSSLLFLEPAQLVEQEWTLTSIVSNVAGGGIGGTSCSRNHQCY
jgi:hypothetical protein